MIDWREQEFFHIKSAAAGQWESIRASYAAVGDDAMSVFIHVDHIQLTDSEVAFTVK